MSPMDDDVSNMGMVNIGTGDLPRCGHTAPVRPEELAGSGENRWQRARRGLRSFPGSLQECTHLDGNSRFPRRPDDDGNRRCDRPVCSTINCWFQAT